MTLSFLRPKTRTELAAHRVLAVLMYGVLFVATVIAIVFKANAAPAPASFAPLTKQLLPSVVNIRVNVEAIETAEGQGGQQQAPRISPGFEDFFRQFGMPLPDGPQNRDLPSTAMGSGFIIDTSGIVVTNNHVINKADKVFVTLQSGEEFEAELIGTDPKTDLAVLKFDSGSTKLMAVSFGDSDQSEVGDWVLAIGNPFGHLGGSVTAGIISARGRNINAGPYDDFIQIDAAINRGNSGGPLFNMNGKVIGINTAILSPNGGSVGLGFSVPSNLASNVIGQLLEFGATRRGWLGVLIQDITPEIAESLGNRGLKGALVSQVTEKGPAETAGFEVGDLIVSFDGKLVESSQKLPILVAETPVGKEVSVGILRGREPMVLSVMLGQLEKAENLQLSASDKIVKPKSAEGREEMLGLVLSEITDSLAERFEIDPYTEGIVILEVAPTSKAASLGVHPGDVVVKINQKPVSSLAEVKELLELAKSEDRENVLLFLRSQGNARFVALPLKPE
ncbi:MAG: Do family serine endopeptidase [Alphaproteobacteria bacterium]|nr:Do family serine endopeptidase [Alphaproteobacteria bacterium]